MFIVALRLVIGFAILYSSVEKILGGFNAQGDRLNVAGQNGNPPEGMFLWMRQTPWFVEFVNVAVPWREAAIGLGLMSAFSPD